MNIYQAPTMCQAPKMYTEREKSESLHVPGRGVKALHSQHPSLPSDDVILKIPNCRGEASALVSAPDTKSPFPRTCTQRTFEMQHRVFFFLAVSLTALQRSARKQVGIFFACRWVGLHRLCFYTQDPPLRGRQECLDQG